MEDIDIAIIVALDEEYHVLRRALSLTPANSRGRQHTFVIPRHDDPEQRATMVIQVIGQMGLVAATTTTDMLLEHYCPKWLVSIGLSGQLDSDCALGDVVISTDCDLAYNAARLSVGRIDFAGKPLEVHGLRPFLQVIDKTNYLQCRELQIPQAARQYLEERRLWRDFPFVHGGVTCSTDFVVDDPPKKKELQQKNRQFLCTDMESAAIVFAAKSKEFSGHIAIIRAISDPADGTKKHIDSIAGNGTIRHYAMQNATTVLQHAILVPHVMSNGNTPYADRPLVQEAISRLVDVNARLRNSAKPNDAVHRIDCELDWAVRDTELASYVYRARILKKANEIPNPLAREIGNKSNGAATSFFVALHVMRSLLVDHKLFPKTLVPFTHVHTFEVNQYCKLLLESTTRRGHLSDLLDRIESAHEASKNVKLDLGARSNLQAHLSYLLGRVSDQQLRTRASTMLRSWKQMLVERSQLRKDNKRRSSSSGIRSLGISAASLERLSREELLLYRTMQISLVQLGAQDESDRYILSCLTSPRLDAQNRGFHLEYYGDIEYDPAQPLNNEDRLGPMPLTLGVLGKKLRGAFQSQRKYPLRDIDLFTVISLLRSRLQNGVLAEQDRTVGQELLLMASWTSGSERFAMLLDRIKSDLANSNFHPSEILSDIFKLKKLARTGWIVKGRSVRNPESVASHTFGGLAIIEFFLPETKSPEARELGNRYDKSSVLRHFLVHDWAEFAIGDLTPDQKNELSDVQEEHTFRQIGQAFIYSPFVNSKTYDYWIEFERGGTINALLARDVDKLDNLQQLLIEYSENPASIPDFEVWIADLEKGLKTDWGRGIFQFIKRRSR